MVERCGVENMEMQWGSRRCWFVKAVMVVVGSDGADLVRVECGNAAAPIWLAGAGTLMALQLCSASI